MDYTLMTKTNPDTSKLQNNQVVCRHDKIEKDCVWCERDTKGRGFLFIG